VQGAEEEGEGLEGWPEEPRQGRTARCHGGTPAAAGAGEDDDFAGGGCGGMARRREREERFIRRIVLSQLRLRGTR
jgi:hypothetical protein